jgi:hypothetical protein
MNVRFVRESLFPHPVQRSATAPKQPHTAATFVAAFFKRYPGLQRYAPTKILDKSSGGGGAHPEARQAGNEIHLYPKFWALDPKTRDFVFTHEIGHYVLSEYGLPKLIATLNKEGVDAWDSSSLPFGQGNMDEAFADSFASYFLDPGELKRRYPAWFTVVHAIVT